jgi:hypothetical protein
VTVTHVLRPFPATPTHRSHPLHPQKQRPRPNLKHGACNPKFTHHLVKVIKPNCGRSTSTLASHMQTVVGTCVTDLTALGLARSCQLVPIDLCTAASLPPAPHRAQRVATPRRTQRPRRMRAHNSHAQNFRRDGLPMPPAPTGHGHTSTRSNRSDQGCTRVHAHGPFHIQNAQWHIQLPLCNNRHP